MVQLTFSEGGARLLSFVFYVLAARVLAPSGFGVLTYTIALSTFAVAVLGVLALATSRELGAARGDAVATNSIIGSSLVATSAVLLATLAASLSAAAVGLTGSADTVGLLVALTGRTLFELYYGIGRGIGQIGRAAVTYVGGSLTQLVVFGVLALVIHPSPRVALVIFGASSAVPIIACELFRPVLRRHLAVRRAVIRQLWTIGAPVFVAHALYLVWLSADQVWVESTLGTRSVGIYGSARNLSQVLTVLPAGVAGVLLPRMAELRSGSDSGRARRLMTRTAAGVLAMSGLLAFAVIALRRPLIVTVYGEEYAGAASSLFGLAVGAAVYAGVVTLTSAAVGWGRPRVYTLAIAVAALSEVGYLWVVGGDRPETAAWASAGSIGLALVVVSAWLYVRPLEASKEGTAPAR